MISSINELLKREAQAVLNIPVTDAYEKAVALIVEQVHEKKGKLVTSGMGSLEKSRAPYALQKGDLFFIFPGCVPAS